MKNELLNKWFLRVSLKIFSNLVQIKLFTAFYFCGVWGGEILKWVILTFVLFSKIIFSV